MHPGRHAQRPNVQHSTHVLRILLYGLAGLIGLGIVGYFTVIVPIVDARKNTV